MEYMGADPIADIFSSYMRIHYPQQQQVPQTAKALEDFIAQQRLTAQQATALRERFEQSKASRNRLTMYAAVGASALILALMAWRFGR